MSKWLGKEIFVLNLIKEHSNIFQHFHMIMQCMNINGKLNNNCMCIEDVFFFVPFKLGRGKNLDTNTCLIFIPPA